MTDTSRTETQPPAAAEDWPHNGLRVFLADLHLDGGESPRAQVFRAMLQRLAQKAAEAPVELYVLGDLFEFWEEYHAQVARRYERDLAALEAAHRAGVRIALLDGNRDFAYGRYVEKRLGARLLHDGARLKLADARPVWLEHGDLLCTADRRYLCYRRIVRSFPVRLFFRLLPWFLARRLVGSVSARAKADKARKDERVFEVDLPFARQRLEEEGCKLLLCGHTHRPEATDLGAGYRLLALPAWCETHAGYVEQRRALLPVRFDAEGAPQPATAEGLPRTD